MSVADEDDFRILIAGEDDFGILIASEDVNCMRRFGRPAVEGKLLAAGSRYARET